MTTRRAHLKRRFDLVLYGATGFVGRRAADYLMASSSRRLRWAIAGRDAGRLEALRAELLLNKRTGNTLPEIVVAESSDAQAVDSMVRQAHVLITTAGPYALYGDGIVDACVRHRTHYADITGETTWVRGLIDRHHAQAARDGTRIVPFCGFDSVPSDLGTLLLVRHIQQAFDAPCVEVKAYFQMFGGFNGGTLASNLHRYEAGTVEAGRDPFLLNPRARRSVAEVERNRDPCGAAYDASIGTWVAPFVMGQINTRVVRRSAALHAAWGEAFGPGFQYQEYLKFDPPLAQAKARAVVAGMNVFDAAMERPATRSVLSALLPRPGAGPSEAMMAAGWFTTEFVGRTADGRSARGRIAFRGDPGNRATLRLLCEAGLCLAQDWGRLPGGSDCGGVLTPATALGEALVPRLRAAGFEIEVGR